MGFIEKTFDLKKCARALHRHPGGYERKLDPDALTPKDLNSCMYDVYIEVLRHDEINIRNLDFSQIGDGDIDDLENALYYSPASELFSLGEVFKQFAPSVADKRVFI